MRGNKRGRNDHGRYYGTRAKEIKYGGELVIHIRSHLKAYYNIIVKKKLIIIICPLISKNSTL